MKTKLPLAALALALVLATVTAVGADKPKADTKNAAAADTKAAAAGETGKETKKKMIEKGMNAEQITELFGKPKEIKPMTAPDPETKVEQWIYRRKLREGSVQVAAGQTMVPTYSGFSGGGNAVTETPVIEYRMKHVVVYQVTALLMVNGKLEIAKQWPEEEEKLE